MNKTEFNKLSEAQRIATQQRLKDKNLYSGDADGKWGNGTELALKLEEKQAAKDAETARQSQIEQTRAATDALRAKTEQTTAEAKAKVDTATAKATETKTKAKEKYDEQANSDLGVATQIAAGGPSLLGGYTVGRGLGMVANARADRSQAKKNTSLRGVAEARLQGLTTRDGSVAGAERSGAMPPRNAFVRVGSRMIPHALFGAGMGAKGAAMLATENEDDPFYSRMANRGQAIGLIGAGLGALDEGAQYATSPGEVPNARDIAIIESNQLRRNGLAGASQIPPGTPPPSTPLQTIEPTQAGLSGAPPQQAFPPPATPPDIPPESTAPPAESVPAKRAFSDRLIGAARKAGATGDIKKGDAVEHLTAGNITDQNRAAVARELGVPPGRNFGERISSAIADMAKRPGAKAIGALIAGGTAYLATPKPVEASEDGSVTTDRSEALTNAGLTGAVAVAAQRYAPKALNFVAQRSGPMMLSDMAADLGRYLYSKGYMQPPMQKTTESAAGAAGAAVAPNEARPGNLAYPMSGGQDFERHLADFEHYVTSGQQ